MEIANESFKNVLSDQEVYDLGKRFKQTAPNVMLAGSSPTGDGGEEGGNTVGGGKGLRPALEGVGGMASHRGYLPPYVVTAD